MDFLEYVRMCQDEPDQEKRKEKLCKGLIYKVQAGDTLYSISKKYDLRVRDLMRANPFVNVYDLRIGEELCVPVAGGQLPEGVTPYVVKRGDTLLSIIEENRVTFEELARLNKGIASLRLPVGMTILIPPSAIQPRVQNGQAENLADRMLRMPGQMEADA